MARSQRQRDILERLEADGEVSVGSLAETFDVSEMTIRRDLRELERTGLVDRVYGGAVRSLGRAYEPPFRSRALQHSADKEAIARTAASMINQGDAIGLDVGSTVLAMVPHIVDRHGLTVVTSSLRVSSELAAGTALERNLRLIVTGGVARAEELSLVGLMAVEAYRNLRLDVAFIGVGGISADDGATEFSVEDTEVKRAMLQSARKVVVLADSTKLGRVCFATIADCDALDVVVTDQEAGPERVESLRSVGLEVVIAESGDIPELPQEGV